MRETTSTTSTKGAPDLPAPRANITLAIPLATHERIARLRGERAIGGLQLSRAAIACRALELGLEALEREAA